MVQADTDREERAERSPCQILDEMICEAQDALDGLAIYGLSASQEESYRVAVVIDGSPVILSHGDVYTLGLAKHSAFLTALQLVKARCFGDRTDDPTSDTDSLKQNPNKEG